MPFHPRFGVLIRAVAPSRESRPTPTGHPAETGCRAASAPRRFAPAVRVGLPSNRSLGEDSGRHALILKPEGLPGALRSGLGDLDRGGLGLGERFPASRGMRL